MRFMLRRFRHSSSSSSGSEKSSPTDPSDSPTCSSNLDVPPEQDEVRSSDETEEGDEMYVVDYFSDSDSDENSLGDVEDSYVVPPVTIPEMYRRQDRIGGITVAGARVLFTFAGFKRRQMLLGKLKGVPEFDVAPSGQQRECIAIRSY
ncbi:hypothetical protein BBJ29_007331 [Phytophthora kernoviae]|uniref:Uncharacterized protein n=1 Tax=Phytophthora kernoviae TaxID=325452 RepID=A0A3F2RKL9_9STRA|nr:hypothetical protein BBP00_00007117 [Phytophthora kernoviae]RLN64360.1 hypothetical protein BBJ29_007331 [Phytophthora kernoviae]